MFENFLSLGSLISVTLSFALTIKALNINYVNNSSVIKSEITGNNNNVYVNYSDYSGKISSFKRLWVCIELIILALFPVYPDFFIDSLSTFSICALFICATGTYKNISENVNNGIYSLFYLIGTAVISFFSISALSIVHVNKYIFTDYYLRAYETIVGGGYIHGYSQGITSIIGEGVTYLGLSILFISLIHCCFGFLNRDKNFDVTFDAIFRWVPGSLFGHFFACGGVIAILNLNFNYITWMYQNVWYYFFSYFL